jgi:hypothetical protein
MRGEAQVPERAQEGPFTEDNDLRPAIYEELRKLAAAKIAHEPSGQTVQATVLVHLWRAPSWSEIPRQTENPGG